MNFKPIDSVNNKKVKFFLKLSKYKKVREIENMFVIEGFNLVLDAIKFNASFVEFFSTINALEKINYKFKEIEILRYVNLISNQVATKMSSTLNNQGIFAIVRKNSCFTLSSVSQNSKVLTLVEISDPGNLGTLIRSAAAFNFKHVILVNCCDLYNPKVIRSTMSAIFKVSILKQSIPEVQKWLELTNLRSYAAALTDSSINILNMNISNSGCVLCVGNEARGLPKEILCYCNHIIKINMNNEIDSLNAAVAGSILMFYMSDK